jgi:hypothetical protein
MVFSFEENIEYGNEGYDYDTEKPGSGIGVEDI